MLISSTPATVPDGPSPDSEEPFLVALAPLPGLLSIFSEYFQHECIHTDRLTLPFLATEVLRGERKKAGERKKLGERRELGEQ